MRVRSYIFAVADLWPRATLLGCTILTYTISWSLWGIWAVIENGSALTGTVLFVHPVGGVAGATTILGFGLLVTTLTVAVVALVTTAGTSLGADRPTR